MQEGQNARQQIVERIRQSASILVAVGSNPTVDSLSAALGLSLMLNKMNKHTTAVFSGQVPPAIQFLEPNKVFENNVDALRDFIISLDKEKADRLRYKVEDDVVRIFITPYKTSISEKDLQFSQGDFNVDLIIALGVEKRDELDKAIVAHGRILHDATVVTINANNQHSSLGSIDWNDATASSLCEMLVSISETFQQPGLLDQQISTALLTGIVAATERFSNQRTTPRIMTMAAQLMAAGANQQLIASNLAKAQILPQVTVPPVAKQQAAEPQPMPQEPPKKKPDGELDITHEQKKEAPKPAPAPAAPIVVPSAEDELAAALPATTAVTNTLEDLKHELAAAPPTKEQSAAQPPQDDHKTPGSESVNAMPQGPVEHDQEYISSHGSWKGKRLEPPTLGGTLNATTEQAMKDEQKAQEADRNKMLLTHPDDGGQKSRRQRRDRKDRARDDKNKKVEQAPTPVVPTPPIQPSVPEPAPTPSQPALQVASAIEVPPAPQPVVVAPEPIPEPVVPVALPEPPPLPAAAPALPPAEAPAPLPPPEPQPQPAAVPSPTPAPVMGPLPPATAPPAEPTTPNLEDLHKEVAQSAAEAAAVAQPADATAGDLSSARQAVSDAFAAQPFNPAGQPAADIGTQPLPAVPPAPVNEPAAQVAAPAPIAPDLPPLPPMPPLPQSDTALPPAPDLPGLNEPLPPIAQQASAPTPPQAPAPQTPSVPSAPADPGQFKIPGA